MDSSESPSQVQLQDAVGDRYALERELGRGGMGRVWLARDLRLDRPVAIKLLHPELAADRVACDRFLREARTAAALVHPHIVPILGVESRGDVTFLVMAMIDGETLGARVRRRGPLPSAEVERLVREIGWALSYAHSRGVTHRDITPENVLLERGTDRALLVDFGLAGVTAGITDTVAGTPGYLAPEVIRGDAQAVPSELYSLAATAWFGLTGSPPYSGSSVGEVLAKHLVQPLPDLPAAAQGASRRLVAAIRNCLEKDPEARPADVGAFLAGLDRAPPPVTLAPALTEWFTRWERIRPGYAIIAPVLALQLLLLMESYLNRGGLLLEWAAATSWLFATILVPLGAHLAAEITSLHRLAARGFGIGDIRAAWDEWTATLRRAHRRDGLPPLAGRVLFDLTVVGAAVIVIGSVMAITLLPVLVPPPELGWTVFALMRVGSWVFLGTAAGISINLLAPGIRLDPDGPLRRLSHRFWRGRLAQRFAQVAGIGLRRAAAPTSTIHRHTELVLGLAIDTLWRALPDHDRQAHPDLPGVAATLQRGAEELRTLLVRLTEAADALAPGDAEARRLAALVEATTARHREAVARLESLRLQLLRSVALRSITADLTEEIRAARVAEQEVLHGIAGATAVRTALAKPRRDPERRTPTPTPTPAPT